MISSTAALQGISIADNKTYGSGLEAARKTKMELLAISDVSSCSSLAAITRPALRNARINSVSSASAS